MCHVWLCLEDPAGGLKQTWKGVAALLYLPITHSNLSCLLSPGTHKTAALCVLEVRHIKNATFKRRTTKAPFFRESLKGLKWLSISRCDCAFHIFLSQYTRCKMLQVGDNKSCTRWMSTHQLLRLDNRRIYLFGDSFLMVTYTEARNWLWPASVSNAYISMHIGFFPISYDRTCHRWTLPEFESCLSGPLVMIIIATIQDHWATRTKKGSIKL